MKGSLGILLLLNLIAGCGGPAASAPATVGGPAATAPPATAVPPSALPPATGPAAGTVPPATPSAAATPSSSASGSAYQQLLALVPPAIANTCVEDALRARIERALAVAYCEPEDVIDPEVTIDSVTYFMRDPDEIGIDLWTEYWGHLGEPANGECAAGPATSVYEVDGLPVGRLVCGPMPQTGQLAAWWYDDRLGVVMALFLVSGGYDDLANLVPVVTVQP